MSLRQSAGPFIALLVLNLSVAPPGSRCVAGHPRQGHRHHTPAQQRQIPAIPLCCQVLPSCGETIGSRSAAVSLATPAVVLLFSASLNIESLSRFVSPETPPPRA
jgi:hypothetical protein